MTRIYHWNNVEVLHRHAHGDIIVAANSLEEAKAQARISFEKFSKDNEVVFSIGEYAFGGDQEDKENRKKMLDRLEADLSKDPMIGHTVFVWGSE